MYQTFLGFVTKRWSIYRAYTPYRFDQFVSFQISPLCAKCASENYLSRQMTIAKRQQG